MSGFLRYLRVMLAVSLVAVATTASAAEIVIIPHEAGYYTSLARHLQRWLKGEGVPSELVEAKDISSALKDSKLAFLVGFDNPTAGELSAMKACRVRGGRFVVFYSSSSALADMMGVKLLGYRAATYPGEWSRMDFNVKFPDGCPKSILQTSTVLQRATAIQGRSRVMATWSDRNGKSTGEAAWISSSGGFWMTHVLTADGDEDLKTRLIAAMVGAVAPNLWNASKADARAAAERKQTTEFAKRQSARKGEIKAVWDHSGCGLYPGDWPRTFRTLKSANVTDLFVNVAGAGFAHYRSDVLPRSKIFEQEGDQLAKCLAAAKGTGIRVHAWVLCFNATRSTPERLKRFANAGWRLKSRDGSLTEYLDPSNPAVRKYILSAVDEIQSKYAVSGIHLDFVRWGDTAVKNDNPSGTITSFVAEARRHVKRPRWFTVAVYGKYPQCIATVGQDWYGWLDANLVDYAVPMDYTESPTIFSELLGNQSASRARARRTIIGIGVTANESRLSARQVMEQTLYARKRGFAGVSLFDLDITLEKRILPYLAMGLW